MKSLQDLEVIGVPNLQLTLLPCCYYRRQEITNYNVEVASTGIVLHEVSRRSAILNSHTRTHMHTHNNAYTHMAI